MCKSTWACTNLRVNNFFGLFQVNVGVYLCVNNFFRSPAPSFIIGAPEDTSQSVPYRVDRFSTILIYLGTQYRDVHHPTVSIIAAFPHILHIPSLGRSPSGQARLLCGLSVA
jgi:hypothetical protein